MKTITYTNQPIYTKIYDNPDGAIRGHIGIEWYGLDIGAGNIDGTGLFAIGVNARYPITKKLLVEGLVRTPLLKFENTGFSFITDAGILYQLSSRDVKQKFLTCSAMPKKNNV